MDTAAQNADGRAPSSNCAELHTAVRRQAHFSLALPCKWILGYFQNAYFPLNASLQAQLHSSTRPCDPWDVHTTSATRGSIWRSNLP